MRNFIAAPVAAALAVMLVPLAPAAAVPTARHGPPRLALWMEPGANLLQLSTPEGVDAALDRAHTAGVDVVMPEAKNAWGYVTFHSTFAPTIADSPLPHEGPGTTYPPPTQWYPRRYDMLATIIAAAHARGMLVDAAVNSFGEGYSPLRAGPAFTHPDWQATAYLATRRIFAPDGRSYALSGVNVPRDDNTLVLYTSPAAGPVPTSRWGVDVAIAGGTVTAVQDRSAGPADPGALVIPKDGYVLSGHGTAADWLRAALRVGDAVSVGPVETYMAPSSSASIFAFVNPANPVVWNYELGVVYDLITHYDVDGIVLDRTRYEDVSQDFSPLSRLAFEQFLGRRVAHWPDDIYTYAAEGYWVTRRPGPLYRQWLGYRAHTIMAYTRAVTRLVRTIRPNIDVAMYVGSWYSVYYAEGSNWGSPGVRAPYSWIGDDWVRAGLAPLLDYLMIGLYYRPVTIREVRRQGENALTSVQGAAVQGLAVVNGGTPVVGALLAPLYTADPEQLSSAIRMSNRLTRGTMLFDLVYMNADQLWGDIPAR
jgi:uncharacterized lipoprotein YddW (UPF0748 family)